MRNVTRIAVWLVATALVASLAAAGEDGATGAGGAGNELIAQPASVLGQLNVTSGKEGDIEARATHFTGRGNWRIYDGPLPTMENLASYHDDPVSIYGLYLWLDGYLKYREDIRAVGFSNFRVGGIGRQADIADEGITALIEDGVAFTIVLGAKKRDEFETDQAFIDNALVTFRKVIERYGPGGSFFKDHPDVPRKPVMSYQIWNEPNFQYMYKGDGTNAMIPVRQKLYAKLLPAAYRMIKGIDPKIEVVGWTCGGAAAQDLPFVKNALKANPEMATAFDVFSTHPYTHPAPPDAWAVQKWGEYSLPNMLLKIRETFVNAGRPVDKLPVWYTEGGWTISRAEGGMFDAGRLDKDIQSAYYLRYYLMGLRLGVNRITVMSVVDTDGFNGGIFNRTAEWKRDDANPWRPVAHAIQNMIRLMPNPKLSRIFTDGTGGEFVYEFTSDKRKENSGTTIVAWKVTPKAKPVTLDIGDAYDKPVVVDMYGHTQPLTVTDGAVTVDIGPYPVFITRGR